MIQGTAKLEAFLSAVLPEVVPFDSDGSTSQSRQDLIADVLDGVKTATMAVRLT